MSDAKIKIDASDLQSGFEDFGVKVKAATKIYAETVAKSFESYAKANRPWTDRTGRARQGLTGSTEDITNGERVIIAHTVDYGIMLEMGHEKRYAILEPTVRLKGPEAIKGLSHLFDRLGG